MKFAAKAWEHIQGIETCGMAAAIETGLPKMRRRAAAALLRTYRFRCTKIKVVNEYRLEHEDTIDILEVNNTAVRKQQIERLQAVKSKS